MSKTTRRRTEVLMTVLKIFAAGLAALTMLAGAAAAKPVKPDRSIGTIESPLVQARAGFTCVAVGRTIRGRRIPGVLGVARGVIPRNVCRRAVRQCNADLQFRQRRGLNPFGQCEVTRRGFAFRF